MLPLEKLRAVKKIVCHGPTCADGLASAIILQDALRSNNPEIVFCQYGKEQEQLKAEPHMLLCDFSPHKDRVQEFVDAGAIVLDHHRWTKDVVAQFGDLGVFADEVDEPGVSGAVLAYREVWKPLMENTLKGSVEWAAVERFASLAGVYDTWQTKDSRWFEGRVQERTLRTFAPKELLGQEDFFATHSWWAEKLAVGKVLVDKLDAQVDRALRQSYRYNTSKGTRVIIFEDASLTSMAAEVVGDAADLIVGFSYGIEDDNQCRMIISTRSHTGYNCMELAGAFGGGGHTAAAGFSKVWPVKDGSKDPYSVVKAFIQTHETSRDAHLPKE